MKRTLSWPWSSVFQRFVDGRVAGAGSGPDSQGLSGRAPSPRPSPPRGDRPALPSAAAGQGLRAGGLPAVGRGGSPPRLARTASPARGPAGEAPRLSLRRRRPRTSPRRPVLRGLSRRAPHPVRALPGDASQRAGRREGRRAAGAGPLPRRAPRPAPRRPRRCFAAAETTLRLKRGHHRGRGGGAAPGIPRGIRRRARHARRIRAARKARASAGDGGAGRGRRLAWPGARRPHALRAAGGPPRPPLGAEAQVRRAGRHARVWGGGVHGGGHGGSGARDAGEDGAAGLCGRSWSCAPTSGHARAARARAASTARSLTAVGILCLLAFLPAAFFPGFYFKVRGARVPCVLTGESNVFYLFYLVTQESQGH